MDFGADVSRKRGDMSGNGLRICVRISDKGDESLKIHGNSLLYSSRTGIVIRILNQHNYATNHDLPLDPPQKRSMSAGLVRH